MKIKFYRTFNEKGEAVILVHKFEMQLCDLPEEIKEKFEEVESQTDNIDISNLSSRWWLCKTGAESLESKGFDYFTFVRG